MAKIVIINDKPEGVVEVDGVAVNFDLTPYVPFQNFWALQWSGNSGEIEFTESIPNQVVNNLDLFQNILTAYNARVAELSAPKPLSPEEIVRDYEFAIHDYIDEKLRSAKPYKFDDANSLGKYVGYANPFQAVAETYASWVASVWVTAGNMLEQWQAGQIAQPSKQEVINALPAFPQV